MSHGIHFIAEFVLQPRSIFEAIQNTLENTGQKPVARFERHTRLDDMPQPGVTFRGIGPGDFVPTNMVYDVEHDHYVIEAKWGVCHREGGCSCQGLIRQYLADDRWTLICTEVPTEAEAEGSES